MAKARTDLGRIEIILGADHYLLRTGEARELADRIHDATDDLENP